MNKQEMLDFLQMIAEFKPFEFEAPAKEIKQVIEINYDDPVVNPQDGGD